SGSPAATLRNVLESMPDVIVMGANPPQLDCCDLLGDVKGSEQTRRIRVIMLASGGSAERVRGLELGADDVLSLPFEDRELLARVRAQFREKRPEDELRESVRSAKQSGRQSRRLLHALNEGRRLLRFGILVLATLALFGIGIVSFLYWRSQKQNVRVYSALAKLQTGVMHERDLIELARRSKTDVEANVNNATQAQQQILKQKNQ